ncbi:MAG: hypothetical protein JXJ22_18405 [Bacteroidales bacterium]|nr:hypothetical protein [Bacteroidales bacterium]
MENEQEFGKLYELIEQFNFTSLPEPEKMFVLKHLSEKEYNRMRLTILDTQQLFSKYPEYDKKDQASGLKRILTFPVELYKIVATLLIIAGIGYLFSRFSPSGQTELFAVADTVYIEKTDTVVIEKTNTIEVIKDRIVYKEYRTDNYRAIQTGTLPEDANIQQDCLKEICPEDMVLFSNIKNKSDLSTDSALKNFIVAVN